VPNEGRESNDEPRARRRRRNRAPWAKKSIVVVVLARSLSRIAVAHGS